MHGVIVLHPFLYVRNGCGSGVVLVRKLYVCYFGHDDNIWPKAVVMSQFVMSS